MRTLPSAVLTVALAPALVALPTVTPPRAEPRPVSPAITTLDVAGVDQRSLAGLGRAGDATARRTLAATATATAPATATARAGAAAAGKVAVLTPQQITGDFGLLGVTWDAAAGKDGVDVSVRIREDSGWTDWEPLGVSDEGPDSGSAEAAAIDQIGTDPLLTEGADGVQVRVDTPTGRPPAGLEVSLIDPGTSPADAQLTPAPPASSAAAAASQPTIITRAQWGADESLRDGAPRLNSTVKAMFLHHTASTNSYTSSTAARELRAVYAYHTQVRGYSDLAYNFFVDKYGRIYEGRYGSITLPVRGAHTGGFNVDTMAVSALGNYDVTAPSSAMVEGIARVAAWKMGQYGISPTETVRLVADGASGTTSKYRDGQVASVKGFDAHRTVGYTACPGQYLYDKMSALRSRIAALGTTAPAPGPTPAGEAPSAPRSLTASAAAGRVTVRWSAPSDPGSSPVTGYRVSVGTAARTVTGTATAFGGLPPGIFTVQAKAVSAAGTSPTAQTLVTVGAYPTVDAPTGVTSGSSATVRLRGLVPGARAVVQTRPFGGDWASAASVTGAADGTGSASVAVQMLTYVRVVSGGVTSAADRVAAYVLPTLTATSPAAGKVRASVTLRPSLAGVPVRVYRVNADGSRTLLATPVTASGSGVAAATLSARSGSTLKLQALPLAGPQRTGRYGAVVAVRVR